MMSRLRWFALTLPFLFVSLAYAGGPEYPPTKNVSVSCVNAEGYFNLILKKGSRIKVTVTSHHLEPLRARIIHHTLYVRAPWLPPIQKRPVVTVTMPTLTRLVVNGPTNVRADRLQSSGLSILSLGWGNIQLKGKMKVNHIVQRGQNYISLGWLDSSTLSIDSRGNGSLYLAGVAKMLYARLAGNAILGAQYLRANHIQVQTQNNASAYVMPLNTLRAFASGKANIYYYSYPKNLTRDTKQSGNVLQMAWRE
ncbi:GIN domain-containing protein [Coxiella burnetii]|uniref:GIN domain-containing protein n=1 Tax=Coxiella burnetii TaxID=777 RepID=UPI0009B842D7|nr:DUF2807 domain-containing protein [Coxiella burnetii]